MPKRRIDAFKIRCITGFLIGTASWKAANWCSELEATVAFLHKAKELYEIQGYVVQTVRVATNLLALHDESLPTGIAMELAQAASSFDLNYLSLGAYNPDNTKGSTIQDIHCFHKLLTRPNISFSFAWPTDDPMHLTAIDALADHILKLAPSPTAPFKDQAFRFAVSFNCKPGIPFFPVASAPKTTTADFGPGRRCFALGLESVGLLNTAFSRVKLKTQRDPAYRAPLSNFISEVLLKELESSIKNVMTEHLVPLEQLTKTTILPASSSFNNDDNDLSPWTYLGIDSSINPSLSPPTITDAYEFFLGAEGFGKSGTLAVSGAITDALKALPVKLTGYCGLMLPMTEDAGLAKAAIDGRLNYNECLLQSTVCGCGIDVVPIPGGPTMEASKHDMGEGVAAKLRVKQILTDVATVSRKYGRKQLACRLLPIKDAQPGDVVDCADMFDCPHILPCRVQDV
jgi:uncharacterized protein